MIIDSTSAEFFGDLDTFDIYNILSFFQARVLNTYLSKMPV